MSKATCEHCQHSLTFDIQTEVDNTGTATYYAWLSTHFDEQGPYPGVPKGRGENEYEAIADVCSQIARLMAQ